MKKGIYKYLHLVRLYPVKEFTRHELRVVVEAEKDGRFKVKFLGFHADGRGPGTKTWVQSSKVVLDEMPDSIAPPDWLPYKD